MKKLHSILKHRFLKIIFSFPLAKNGFGLFHVFTRIYYISDTWLSFVSRIYKNILYFRYMAFPSSLGGLERPPRVGGLTNKSHYWLSHLCEERFDFIEVTLE